ncbi:MAG: sigma 54-interacting transcriptional regulator [Deltaproteobacteria bacterium]|nr:sigma 54-interacting transcriptional regulator [Deltaproteobacteria bacterium]
MKINEKDFFREATLRICGSLDIDKALHQCFLYIRDYIPADRIGLSVFDYNTGDPSNLSVFVAGGKDDKSKNIPLPDDIQRKLRRWLNDKGPAFRIIDRISEDGILGPISRLRKWKETSGMVMRIMLEGKILGSLIVGSFSGVKYTENHLRLLGSLNEPFAIALSNSLQHLELQRIRDRLADDKRYLQEEMQRLAGEEIIGADFGLKQVMELVLQVAPLGSPVLLLGETGVGKEVIANAIHNASRRRKGPFIKVNCGAIPDTLIDSELFGHEKGAFTGAFEQKRGRFERADGGSIFLDEIGELPPKAQVRLLRVLQEKIIERVGGNEFHKVDIRVIAASHRNLEKMLEDGSFREDLYFRLKVFPIMIPALRKRHMDIPALVQYFIQKKSKEMGLIDIPGITAGAMDTLLAYHWPGNVRELENAIERALILAKNGIINFDDLPFQAGNRPDTVDMKRDNKPSTLDAVVTRHIIETLEKADGRIEGIGGAAQMLDINPSTLRKRMRKLGIPYGRLAGRASTL